MGKVKSSPLVKATIVDMPLTYEHEPDFDQALSDSAEARRPTAAKGGEPENKSQAIRRALMQLGLDAPASAVRTLILDQWPQFESQVKDDKNWSQNVSQNRKRAAAESGSEARSVASDDGGVDADEIQTARLLAQKVGAGADGVDGAREILRMIERLGSVERAKQAIDVWDEIVQAANGDENIAERMISVIASKLVR